MTRDNAAKLLLAPILIAQALRVRKGAQMLPEPPGARQGTAGSGAPLRLLIVGDSSGAGVGSDHQSKALSGCLVSALTTDHHVTWRLEAKTGATTATTLDTIATVPRAAYDVAVVALGVNDVTSMVTGRQLLTQRAQLYHILRNDFGARRIIVSGIPPLKHFPLLPQPLRWVLGCTADRFDAALAAQVGIEYLRFNIPFDADMMARDGFHPGPTAYHIWAQTIADHITHHSIQT